MINIERFVTLIEKFSEGSFSLVLYADGWTAMLEYPMPDGDGDTRFVGQSKDPEGAIAALLEDMGVVA